MSDDQSKNLQPHVPPHGREALLDYRSGLDDLKNRQSRRKLWSDAASGLISSQLFIIALLAAAAAFGSVQTIAIMFAIGTLLLVGAVVSDRRLNGQWTRWGLGVLTGASIDWRVITVYALSMK